jgi:hypothetical protein
MSPTSLTLFSTIALTCLGAVPAFARPIVSAGTTTSMLEYRDGAMREAQIYYAPEHFWSAGLGRIEFDGHNGLHEVAITYARLNLLAKRWNMESAQGNLFVWGGLGTANIREGITATPGEHDHGGPLPTTFREFSTQATNWGGQIDFETRRLYASFKTDLQDTSRYWHRVDTVELGFAPYKHGVDSLATWLVVAASNYAGNLHEGTETAVLLRFFKKRIWVEGGATTDGLMRASAMFNF